MFTIERALRISELNSDDRAYRVEIDARRVWNMVWEVRKSAKDGSAEIVTDDIARDDLLALVCAAEVYANAQRAYDGEPSEETRKTLKSACDAWAHMARLVISRSENGIYGANFEARYEMCARQAALGIHRLSSRPLALAVRGLFCVSARRIAVPWQGRARAVAGPS